MADIITTTPAGAGGTRIHVSLGVRRRRLVHLLDLLDSAVSAERAVLVADTIHKVDPDRHAACITGAEEAWDAVIDARSDLEAVVPSGAARDPFTHLCKLTEFALNSPDAESLAAMREILEWHVTGMQTGRFADPAAKDAAYLAREVSARIATVAELDRLPPRLDLAV